MLIPCVINHSVIQLTKIEMSLLSLQALETSVNHQRRKIKEIQQSLDRENSILLALQETLETRMAPSVDFNFEEFLAFVTEKNPDIGERLGRLVIKDFTYRGLVAMCDEDQEPFFQLCKKHVQLLLSEWSGYQIDFSVSARLK